MRQYLLILDEITGAIPRYVNNAMINPARRIITTLQRGAKRNLFSIMATQSPGAIAQEALNVGTPISFNLNSNQETREMEGPLALRTQAQKLVLGKLSRRTAIICRHAVFPEPVRFYTDEFPLEDISDAVVKNAMASEVEELMADVVVRYNRVEVTTKPKQGDNSRNIVLKCIVEHPGKFGAEIAKAVKLTPATVSNVLKACEQEGLIEFRKFVGRGDGNAPKIPELTEAGIACVGKAPSKGVKGGIVAYRWTQDILTFYESYRPVKEYFINDRESVDVAIVDGMRRILAVEIEIHSQANYDHCVRNIQKCLNAGFEKVVSAVVTQRNILAVKKKAEDMLDAESLGHVIFCKLSDFLAQNSNHLQLDHNNE